MSSRNTFSGQLGFILTAAGSAVGLGNIWRFPYLAAKDGGGLFLLVYLILAATFGFTLLTTEIALGRKTQKSALFAYGAINQKFKHLGTIACLIPFILLSYYCVVGGWVMKYAVEFVTGGGVSAAEDGFFGGFITAQYEPLVYTLIFLGITVLIVSRGVNKGIEKFSKTIMPVLFLMIVGIAVYSLTLSHTDADGTTRTGLDGLKVFVIPDFTGLTMGKLLETFLDAMGQLFFSLSLAAGIMVSWGSYVKRSDNLVQGINRIEFFDTLAAFLAGFMVIPAVYVFGGAQGLESSGPGLMFINVPKVFAALGTVGSFIGALFFVMVLFAALTSSVGMMEGFVSGLLEKYPVSRRRCTWISFFALTIFATVVCLGYNVFYFEVNLPNGVKAQVLDLMDYVSNNVMMPLLEIGTCILIGWVATPDSMVDELTANGEHFMRRKLYIVMIKYVVPILLFVLLLKSTGIM
ncbi:MAG: sodium-dependent transporter [Bacteroidales bacterium]|nr:sodium-dependent transporter [Bacteroidales bacterium]